MKTLKRKQVRNLLPKICKYCGTTENLTIDHIIRKIDGGTNELCNLQILCRRCHDKKDNIKRKEYPPKQLIINFVFHHKRKTKKLTRLQLLGKFQGEYIAHKILQTV